MDMPDAVNPGCSESRSSQAEHPEKDTLPEIDAESESAGNKYQPRQPDVLPEH